MQSLHGGVPKEVRELCLSIREDLVDMNTVDHHEAMEFKAKDAAMRHAAIAAILEKDASRSQSLYASIDLDGARTCARRYGMEHKQLIVRIEIRMAWEQDALGADDVIDLSGREAVLRFPPEGREGYGDFVSQNYAHALSWQKRPRWCS